MTDYEALAKLGFEALQPGSRWLDQDWDVRQRWLDVARVMVAAFERTMGGESCSSRQR